MPTEMLLKVSMAPQLVWGYIPTTWDSLGPPLPQTLVGLCRQPKPPLQEPVAMSWWLITDTLISSVCSGLLPLRKPLNSKCPREAPHHGGVALPKEAPTSCGSSSNPSGLPSHSVPLPAEITVSPSRILCEGHRISSATSSNHQPGSSTGEEQGLGQDGALNPKAAPGTPWDHVATPDRETSAYPFKCSLCSLYSCRLVQISHPKLLHTQLGLCLHSCLPEVCLIA